VAAIELSIVLPSLNEAETLATCIRKAQVSLDSLGIEGEVLVADNGSTDGSQAIAVAEGARVVDIPKRGYGAALMGGIEAARGEYVLMGDADDSYALEDIGEFVQALRGGADLVMGNRFAGAIDPGAMPFLHRYLGNPVLSMLGRRFFHIRIGDFHCGMRAFRRDRMLALGMRTSGMEFATEMVVRAALGRLRIVEVPTVLHKDGRSRPPHLRTWRDGWRHLRFMLAFSPRWLLLYPAFGLMFIGLAGLIWLGLGPRTVDGVSFDVQTLLAFATFVIVGVQLAGLSIVARSYAAHLGLLPPSPRLERALERVTLEQGLLAGAAAFIAGLAVFVWSLANWASHQFGQLVVFATMRFQIIGMLLVVVGVQLAMVSFTMSFTQSD
jgi:glycosyltransferase involved in cell wall biosynthesis